MTALANEAGRGALARQAAAAPRVDSVPPAGPVGGILFDVPDVLYDATLWRRWLFQLVGRLGIRISYGEFHRAWDAHLVDVHRGRREYIEALESFLLASGLSWALVDEIEAASRIARQNLELAVRPLPGVARAIDELAKLGPTLAAWADAPHTAAILADRLARLVPHTRFDAVLTSFDLECTQPAAECYQAALRALRLSPPQAVYIGHDTGHLAGARAAGMRTVAFNHEPDAVADHYLTRFDDLLALVKSWTILPHPSHGRTIAATPCRI